MNAAGFVSDEAEAEHYRRFDELNRNNGGRFQIIGHGSTGKYILVNNPRRLLVKAANQLRMPVFLAMAPVEWWAAHFPPCKPGTPFDKRQAVNFILRVAVRVGNFDLLTATDPSEI